MSVTLLVIDDSQLARRLVRKVFEGFLPSIDVVEASSGAAGVELAREKEFDVISTDLNMPGIDGIETALQIRKFRSNVPIAVVTANVQQAVRQRAEEAGIVFIAKPPSAASVEDFLRQSKILT